MSRSSSSLMKMKVTEAVSDLAREMTAGPVYKIKGFQRSSPNTKVTYWNGYRKTVDVVSINRKKVQEIS